MNTVVNFGLFLTNDFRNKKKFFLKNLNEYSTINIDKNSYMQIRCS